VSGEQFDFLVGQTVEQLWFWGTIRLVFALGERPEPGMYVDVHACELVSADGTKAAFDAGNDPSDTSPVLRLLKQRCSSASAANGVLALVFESGDDLRALPDDRCESWTVVAHGHGVFQCMAGGEVDSW
jgi:hypothetical protein